MYLLCKAPKAGIMNILGTLPGQAIRPYNSILGPKQGRVDDGPFKAKQPAGF